MAVETMFTVDGKVLPNPSSYKYKLNDISASTAGRTEDTTMHKDRVGQKRTLSLSWKKKSPGVVAMILQALNPQYFSVRYWDYLDGKYETRKFYRGDPEADTAWWLSNSKRSELSVTLIEV